MAVLPDKTCTRLVHVCSTSSDMYLQKQLSSVITHFLFYFSNVMLFLFRLVGNPFCEMLNVLQGVENKCVVM